MDVEGETRGKDAEVVRLARSDIKREGRDHLHRDSNFGSITFKH
jgi:hypothetical protein